jgi:hypothetical protein
LNHRAHAQLDYFLKTGIVPEDLKRARPPSAGYVFRNQRTTMKSIKGLLSSGRRSHAP